MMARALARILDLKFALAALIVAALIVTVPAPLMAQDEVSEARLRKIEAEIRALQRNVFPGGDERFFEPEITPVDPNTARTGPTSTTAVTDILARLDAIELQLQQLTARTEETDNALDLLGQRVAALETTGVSTSDPAAEEDVVGPVEETEQEEEQPQNATASNLAAMGAAQSPSAPTPVTRPLAAADEPEAVPAGPTAERLEAVQAITKPQTDDAADDEYSYGFRLWNAGFYPEARQQLSNFLDQHPDHWRVTYGRNLLGRAYLDDGKPEEAARWFLRNYQADRNAARAPDSLLYLAESMIALEDNTRACIALAEFGETYPAVATGRLLEKYQSNRGKVTCES